MITISHLKILCQYCLIHFMVNIVCSTVRYQIMAADTFEQSQIINQLTYRLPKDVTPTLYELYLYPDLKSSTFSGSVKIHIDVINTIKFIVLHANKLIISDSKLYEESGKCISINATFDHKPLEYLIIVPSSEIVIGKYVLELNFSGDYSNRLVSLYGSTYYDKLTNQSRKIVTTKFQSTYTRHAFPCFDEPAIKSQFDITLVRPSGHLYHALSNMNIICETSHPNDDSLTVVKFARSVPMTAYLLCFIISDFASKEYRVPSNGVGQDVVMRVYSAKNEINKTDFSGELGYRVIQYYLKYFDIPYPLPKLDMVAIPDYISEATENWGLITFRDGLFLYDPEVVSSESKQYTMILVVHEIAHMWFGNLVTIEWWDQLWLNEGFTSWMEYKCGDVMYPQYKMFDQMLIDIQNVLAIDSTVASCPIILSVKNADQISEMFNPITYLKAAAVVRMLEDFVGEEHFRKCISNFLKAHQYSIANSTNLISEIEKVVPDTDIKSFLNTWLHQKGFPYIHVHRTNDSNVYKLTQHRFLVGNGDMSKDTPSIYNYRWEILVTYFSNLSQVDAVKRKLFTWHSDSIDISVEEKHSWIKLNKDRIGYYRVLYPTDIWYHLIDELKTCPHTLSVSDRANLIDDAFSLAEAKLISYEIVMDLLQYLVNEKDFVPWSITSTKLNNIFSILDSAELTIKLKNSIKTIIDPVYQYVGWTYQNGDEFHLKNRLRSVILELACAVGHDACLERAKHEFLGFLHSPSNRPHPDIRRTVYYYGMSEIGNDEIWTKFWQILVNERSPQEHIKLLYGLSAIQDTNILSKLLKLLTTETNLIRDHDYFTYFEYVATNKLGMPLVWKAIRNDWQYFVNRFTLNNRYFGRAVGNILSKFNSIDQYNEVFEFFNVQPEAGAGAGSRLRALENIKNNIEWLHRNNEVLLQWLNRDV